MPATSAPAFRDSVPNQASWVREARHHVTLRSKSLPYGLAPSLLAACKRGLVVTVIAAPGPENGLAPLLGSCVETFLSTDHYIYQEAPVMVVDGHALVVDGFARALNIGDGKRAQQVQQELGYQNYLALSGRRVN